MLGIGPIHIDWSAIGLVELQPFLGSTLVCGPRVVRLTAGENAIADAGTLNTSFTYLVITHANLTVA